MTVIRSILFSLSLLIISSSLRAALFNEEQIQQGETIFQVVLDSTILSDGFMAYQLNGESYLPLGELSLLLEFPITVATNSRRAEGWFIEVNNLFLLDLDKHQLQIRKVDYPLSEKLFNRDGEIYVATDLLSEWFPVNFDVSLSALKIFLTSTQTLPMQQRLARDNRYTNLQGSVVLKSEIPQTEIPYELFSTPAASVNLSMGYHQADSTFSNSYSTQINGDMLYMTGEVFASGNDQEGLKNVRFRLGREDIDSHLLGPLHASSYQLGDITVAKRGLIGGTFSGRGFKVSSTPINQSSEFNSTTLEGDLQPGYDVELYLNGGLSDFQRASDEGRYRFENIPLFQGLNTLKLIFYGPQGQRYEEVQQIYSGGSGAPKGQLHYQFSATQPEQSVFSLNNDASSDLTASDQVAWLANASYGLGRSLTLVASAAQYSLEQRSLNFSSVGLRGSVGAIQAQAEVTADDQGELAGIVGLNSELGPVRIGLSHTQYSDQFVSGDHNADDQLLQLSSFQLDSSPIRSGKRTSASTRLGFANSKYQSGRQIFSVTNSLWLATGPFNLNNDLRYSQSSNADGSGDPIRIDGSFRFSANADSFLKGFHLRSELQYSVEPVQITQSGLLGGSYIFDQQRNISFSAMRNFVDGIDQDIYYSLGYNHRFKAVNLGATINGSNQDNLYIGANLSFSLSPDPANGGALITSNSFNAQSGSVLALSYLDENRNGRLDNGEQPLSGSGFLVNKSYRPGVTNSSGRVLLSGLNAKNKFDIEVSPSTLTDLSLVSAVSGYGITARPGYIAELEFPLIQVGEIEGRVFLHKGSERIEAANVVLMLVNDQSDELVKTLRSEHDGLFYLNNIQPGRYRLKVDETQMRMLGLQAPSAEIFEVESSGGAQTLNDIVLEQRSGH